MENEEVKLAVLIDADNVSDKIFDDLLSEIAKIGEVTVKRIYGDFTSSTNARWKDILNKYAIKPISQFAYTTGKNATDSALIIDAMDLLHTHRLDGFCIVSSDSDYTGLAMRIKEDGVKVYGFGERKTPEAFRNACNKFTFVELLKKSTSSETSSLPATKSSSKKSTKEPSKGEDHPDPVTEEIPYELIKTAIENSCDDSGVARLSTVGTTLLRMKPDFDPRLYKKCSAPLAAILRDRPDLFEMSGSRGTLSVKIKS